MAICVAKFGGSSLADKEKLFIAASEIQKEYLSGNSVVVVVSARGGTTDKLIRDAADIFGGDNLPAEELDKVLATGELLSAAMMALALNKLGIPSTSLSGARAGITTDSSFGSAKVLEVKTDTLKHYLDKGFVVVVAGFQGADKDGCVTTLGRGGSDNSAVILASALKAQKCLIYTDVDGVYTADPRKVINAKKYNSLSYKDMLEYSRLGAKVLSRGSVELAIKGNVPLTVLKPLSSSGGTVIGTKNFPKFSDIVGITASKGTVSVIGKCIDNDIRAVTESLESNRIAMKNVNISEASATFGIIPGYEDQAVELIHNIFF